MSMRLLVVSAAVIFLAASAAFAAPVVVFSSSPVNGNPCSISDMRPPQVVGPFTYVGQETAGVFSLQANADIIGANWWGAYGHAPDPTADSFTIRFYDDVPGQPQYAPIAEYAVTVTRTLTNMDASALGSHDGGDVYLYQAALPSALSLNAGTTYYMSVQNDTYDGQNSSLWGWLMDEAGSNWYRPIGPNYPYDWYPSDLPYNTAFQLLATPEPASMLFFVTGIAGLGLYLRRRIGR